MFTCMKTDLSKVLNPEQAAAASRISGPLLIIAGAGSGKTRMITYRIAHMLEEGIDEKNILALTFTNKAAKEMSDRIRTLLKKPLKELTATTFHSFGLGILKQYIQHLGYHNDFTLYDTNDNEALIKNCIVSCGYQIPDYNVRTLLSFFSDLKTGRQRMETTEGAIAEIYREWLLTQKAYNVVDFDDLILLPIRIFEEKPWVLEKVQDRYRYIMVDEFQDTSHLQYRLVSMIASKYRNIAVVGDDDQPEIGQHDDGKQRRAEEVDGGDGGDQDKFDEDVDLVRHDEALFRPPLDAEVVLHLHAHDAVLFAVFHLFAPQRVHGVEVGRLHGGQQPRADADGDAGEEAAGVHDGVQRYDPRADGAVHDEIGDDADKQRKDDGDQPCEGADDGRFEDEQEGHVLPAPADGAQDADLLRPLDDARVGDDEDHDRRDDDGDAGRLEGGGGTAGAVADAVGGFRL